jgi:hypothetical protein
MSNATASTATEIIIDPNGDTIIVLTYPKYNFDPFRVPPTPEELASPPTATPRASEETVASKTKDVEDALDKLSFEDEAAEDKSKIASKDSSDDDEEEFHFIVSQRQLQITIPYFEKTYAYGFKDSKPAPDGYWYFEAQEFHPKALMHVLNIVHMQNSSVPRQISLEMFAHVAVIVDYYNIKDAFECWVPQWMASLSQKPNNVNVEEDILWLFIGTVFVLEETFCKAAKDLILHCPDFTQDLGLPLNGIMSRLFDHRLNRYLRSTNTISTPWSCSLDTC